MGAAWERQIEGRRCSGEGARATTGNILPCVMRFFKHQSFIATHVDSPHLSVQFRQKVCVPLVIEYFVTLAHKLT
jgi:hypothetical protein